MENFKYISSNIIDSIAVYLVYLFHVFPMYTVGYISVCVGVLVGYKALDV